MAEGGGGGATYKLSAMLELQDLLSGKLKSAASQIKSVGSAVSKLGSNGEVARLAKQFDSLNDLRRQVEQFKQMKKSVAATRQAYEQANATTAALAKQYQQGQSAVAQLQAKHDELKKTFDTSQSATSQLKEKLSGLKTEAAKAKTDGAVENYKKLQEQVKATSAELKASQAMTRRTGSELKSLAGGVKQAQRELTDIGNAFERSKENARKLKRELQTQEPALSRMRQSLNAQGFSTQNFADSDRQLRRRMQETAQKLYTEQRLENLRGTLASAGMTLPTPTNQLRVNVNGNATSTLGKIKQQLTSLTGKAWNIAVNAKNALGGKFSGIAEGAMLGMGAQVLGTAGIGYGIVNAIQSQMGFEKQMSAVQAVLGYGKEEMANLTAAAEQIGYTTKFTAEEAGKAQYYAAMAGWKEPQIVSGVQGIVNLAAAGDVDLKRTADVVTDLMTAFGMKAGENLHFNGKPVVESTQHFVDSMAAMITNSNTDVEQSYEALKYSAPVVSAMYADQSAEARADAMRDSLIITGLMANVGVKGSMAGTSQRALYSRLASENRNAYFAERALPVDFVDKDTGQVRRLRDIVGDFRDKFNNGLDPEAVMDFAEQISGEKIHADTRRKLNSFISNVQKNGGQMTGADRLKMTSMLAGQEAMSGWLSVLLASEEDWNKLAAAIDNSAGKAEEMAAIQMDNLAGDVTLLGSTWDAFQRNLVKGDASAGLREFTQGLKGVLDTANNLFKDGIQFSDFAKIGADAISRLKNKFLELNGIGSLLAGGALFMAMKKILSMGLKIKDTLSAWSKVRTMGDLGGILRGGQGGVIGTSQVGTMHVNAGVVNLMGAARGGVPPATGQHGGVITTGTATGRPATTGGIITTTGRSATTGGITATGGLATAGVVTAGSIAARNSAYVNDYYARRASFVPPAIPPTTSPIPPATSTGVLGTLKASSGAMAGAGVLSLLFGAMDIYSTHQQSRMSDEEAAKSVEYERNMLAELRTQNATQDELNFQMQAVRKAETSQEEIKIANQNAERQAELGAAGMVTGTMLGTALGSFFPVVGNLFGGMLGGILGQWAGTKLAEHENAHQEQMRQDQIAATSTSIPAGSVADFRQNDSATVNAYRESEEYKKTEEYREEQAVIQAQQADEALRSNAAGISRHQKTDYLESRGIDVSEIPGINAVKRHASEYWEAEDEEGNVRSYTRSTDAAAERQSNFRYEQDMTRGEWLAQQRDEYNKRWQEQFGGTSLAGQANFTPDNERDRQLLAQYDEVQANKVRQQSLLDEIKAYQENQGKVDTSNNDWYKKQFDGTEEYKTQQQAADEARANLDPNRFDWLKPKPVENPLAKELAEQSVADHKANLDKLAGVTNAWHQQQKDTLSEIENQKKLAETAKNASQENKGLLGMLDDLIFSKAAASTITSDTNITPSSELPTTAVQREIIEPPKPISGFFDNLFGDFKLPDISQMFSDFNISDMLPDFNLSEWFSKETEEFELLDISQMFSDFDISDMLPDFNLSEWFSKKTADTESLDISTLLPDMSTLGETFTGITENIAPLTTSINEMLTESLSTIPENVSMMATSIGESFNLIPMSASTAFSAISAAASEGWATIQSEWGQVPGFFEGIWAGAAGAASAAGGAIASGLTGVIGGIIGAWQSAAATISGIISSIASAAANAASSISLPSIGGNATGTASWQGGFTEINEQGGEIIDLPQGTRIYPHATTMKLLQRDIEEGKLDNLIGHNATGTASWRGGLTEINERGGEIIDLPDGSRIYPKATLMEMAQSYFGNGTDNFSFDMRTPDISMLPQNEFSTFPQALQFNELAGSLFSNSTSKSTTTQNNGGITISGNTFNVSKESDINEIAFKLFEMMFDSNANYAGA